MDEAQANGTYSLWNECDSLSYYYLFNIDDNGGNISNFKNVGKIPIMSSSSTKI